jgi:hypothetical protein
MKLGRMTLILSLAAVCGAAAPGATQTQGTVAFVPVDVPFGPGERLDYRVSVGLLGGTGHGSMEVLGIEGVRKRPTYHLRCASSNDLGQTGLGNKRDFPKQRRTDQLFCRRDAPRSFPSSGDPGGKGKAGVGGARASGLCLADPWAPRAGRPRQCGAL